MIYGAESIPEVYTCEVDIICVYGFFQEKEMWIGLEVPSFGAHLVINDVPNDLCVPHSNFAERVPP